MNIQSNIYKILVQTGKKDDFKIFIKQSLTIIEK